MFSCCGGLAVVVVEVVVVAVAVVAVVAVVMVAVVMVAVVGVDGVVAVGGGDFVFAGASVVDDDKDGVCTCASFLWFDALSPLPPDAHASSKLALLADSSLPHASKLTPGCNDTLSALFVSCFRLAETVVGLPLLLLLLLLLLLSSSMDGGKEKDRRAHNRRSLSF